MKSSTSARAILSGAGSFGSESGRNQPASSNSRGSISISPPAYSAVKAIINEFGKGQGWLLKYSIPSTSIPTSSLTSLTTVSSNDSPLSKQPERTLTTSSEKGD